MSLRDGDQKQRTVRNMKDCGLCQQMNEAYLHVQTPWTQDPGACMSISYWVQTLALRPHVLLPRSLHPPPPTFPKSFKEERAAPWLPLV